MSMIQKLEDGFDKVVGILSPETAMRRGKMRAIARSRLYDAATKGRRGDGFRPIQDGPRESLKGLATLRQRSRDLSRNNGYHQKAIAAIKANTIGTGIVLQIRPTRKNGKADIIDLWKRWSESTACDFDGVSTFAGLQDIAMGTIPESGEVIIRRIRQDSDYYRKTRQCPLQLQFLEPEYLNESKDQFGLRAGHEVVGGVEYNAKGQRVAYHLYTSHPSSQIYPKSVRVPAEDIIFVYRMDRTGQLRGVPWGASVMLNLHDLDGYEDAELLRRKIAACYAAFITKPEGDGSEADASDITMIDRLEPGLIQELAPGESVAFGNPPQITGYQEYSTAVLHKIASGYQVPYSVLTGDFSQVNYSSGRMGWLEFQRVIDQWRWNMLVPRMLNPIWAWFQEAAELIGVTSNSVTADWTAPRREMVDPSKEIEAIIMSVKAGLISMPEALREMGYEPKTTLDEIQDWNADLDARKIILDSDPRKDPKRLTAENIANRPQTV